MAGARSLWPLLVMLAALRVDLSLREDTQRWSPETGAAACVELGPLAVPAEALDDRLVEAHQVVEWPDLAAVGVPGDLQVDAVYDGAVDLLRLVGRAAARP